ncbi:MAG: aromatic-ring-hydroxylating dioxygenase subunit beta [Gammaproteobacteria bacterium]|nr:aromatic-ring-hydroxylating dioxygenase subunit beta [Gammaproteobacteria bacterium]
MSAAVDSTFDMLAIEQLLYDEADCLDRADLDAWFNMYTDDGTYWMPVEPDQADPLSHISLFYDDRLMMEIRRRNFGHPFAAAMEYPVRCSHIIGNIRVLESDAGSCRVRSNFHAVVYYQKQVLFAGTYLHELVPGPDGLRIRHKRVDIINADAEHGNLVIYL